MTSDSKRARGVRGLVGRWPFISIIVGGFLLGFGAAAAWLIPGTLLRSESSVPNVVGLLFSDASARLSAAGFTVVTGESLYHPTAPKSSVLGQTPAPGVKGLKGDKVTLDVSLGAKRGTVPDVVGMLRADAVKALEAAGFDTPSDVTERLDSRPRGEVLGSTPRSGSTVPQPATVRLIVSAGPDAIGVPSLIGMPIEDALALIGQLGLVAGPTNTDETGSQPDGFVSAQRPAANTPVGPGSTVTLTISRPRAPQDTLPR